MCGLAGYVGGAGVNASMRGGLTRALESLHHRGPDDRGVWAEDPGIGLGHRRLSILDLSPQGHQPMVSADGRLVMVFNGEVYNFLELRRELEGLGHRFRGNSDSEVVLASLQEWGTEAIGKFIGMFAIAVWDRTARRLTLVRDRLGVKPLYYGHDGTALWFGSELRVLRAFTHWKPEIDRQALAEYFRFGYVNAPRSIYRKVFQLLPGHWLEYEPGRQPVVRAYWSVLDSIAVPLAGSEDELAEQLEALMVDAFRLRMIADVPVGVFLSGGIDSSLVAAVLQAHHGNIHTFTIGFNEAEVNEAPYAQRVANHAGTRHTQRILAVDEAKAILPMWGSLYDEPFYDSSGIPTYLVSKVASEQVKVVLSADGGDELFGGYTVYQSTLGRDRKLAVLPLPMRRALGATIGAVPVAAIERLVTALPVHGDMRRWLYRSVVWRMDRASGYLGAATQGGHYEEGVSRWSTRGIKRLLGNWDDVRESVDSYPGSLAEQMCLWDLHNYLPGDVLTKVDRATMAVSIEGREPLLDHRLVEFAFRLPLHLRQGTLGPKHLLKKVLYRYVPRELVERPKMGFAVPLLRWLRGDLGELIDRHLAPNEIRAQGILNPEVVAQTTRAFRAGNDEAVDRVWSLLAFQMWRERWG